MKKIIAFIKKLFASTKTLALKYVQPSITIVEALKAAVNSPAAPVLTAIIPGTLDDFILAKAKIYLPKILQALKISDECLKLTDSDQIILCAISKLKEYDPEAQAANYHNIAAMLSVYLSDKKLSWSEAVHLAEYLYKNK